MYGRPGVVYGFHGCDREVAEKILSSHTEHLQESKNSYDWLGHGIYFWEANPERAFEFAKKAQEEKKISQGDIKEPYVIGAVIELGNCLNLLDHSGLMEVQQAYKMFIEACETQGTPIPANKYLDNGGAYLVRALDCAVFEYLHKYREDLKFDSYDTVMGALWEGNELYPGSGFKDKNHVQLCVRSENCIRGYFRVRELSDVEASVEDWDRQAIEQNNSIASKLVTIVKNQFR